MLYVELDGGISRMQPQSVNWEPPDALGTDGLGAPVYGPYWTCNLGFSYLTLAEFDLWHDAVDGAIHTVRLPHPITGAMADFLCYVQHVTPRLRIDVRGTISGVEFIPVPPPGHGERVCRAATTGADITLTRIQVT